MVQTTSFRHPEQTNSSSPDQAGIASTATVTCPICEAGYVPSLARPDLWQATPDVVEAAFMSICHFCFRCRRPACPECWDFVHRVCGACVQDAHLPFRTEAPPLQGIKFPPIRRVRPIQEERVPSVFVCVYPGRFYIAQNPALLSTQFPGAITTETREEISKRQTEKLLAISPQSSRKQTIPTAQDEPGSTSVEDVGDVDTETERAPVKRRRRILRVMERVLVVILLLVLLAAVVLVVLAEFFPAVNEQVLRLVHIDIQAEIEYLLHLIQSL